MIYTCCSVVDNDHCLLVERKRRNHMKIKNIGIEEVKNVAEKQQSVTLYYSLSNLESRLG